MPRLAFAAALVSAPLLAACATEAPKELSPLAGDACIAEVTAATGLAGGRITGSTPSASGFDVTLDVPGAGTPYLCKTTADGLVASVEPVGAGAGGDAGFAPSL